MFLFFSTQPSYNYHDSLRVMRRGGGGGSRSQRDQKVVQDSLRIMRKRVNKNKNNSNFEWEIEVSKTGFFSSAGLRA